MNGQQLDTWNILLVDDEPDNRAVVSDLLEFYGMTVRNAQNGEDGMQALQDFMPTLILLDLSMPGMDGWEMLKRVRADDKFQAVAVVALTAHAMPGDKKRVMDAGFDGYITKPIAIETLVNDLRSAVKDKAASCQVAAEKTAVEG